MQFDARQIRLILLLLASVVAILTILWFAVLRTNFVPAYQNIRESDASAIVAELDTAGIPYQLANDGHDILVPEGQESEARVAVAGSSISIGGTVGFELFNDSDMGLTEFAQKINFQRAMQGELSRTIMMMGGIEFARVHLAIPERSIFRSSDEAPTAAVTIEMKPGTPLSPQRVAGVQQLVASSVPGLSTYDVAILDENGDLVSAAAQPVNAGSGSPASERGALEAFYSVRARKAIADVLPGLRFDLELTARPAPDGVESLVETGNDERANRAAPDRSDLALGVIVRTPQILGVEERTAIENALNNTLELAEVRGDSLNFTTGALAQGFPASNPVTSNTAPSETATAAGATSEWDWEDGIGELLDNRWIWILLVLLAILLLVVWPRRRLANDEVENFAELLKAASQERRSAPNV